MTRIPPAPVPDEPSELTSAETSPGDLASVADAAELLARLARYQLPAALLGRLTRDEHFGGTFELRLREAHPGHGGLYVDLSPTERDRFCDELDRLRLMLTASEARAEELSGEVDRLRADLARTAAALEWERRRLDRGVTRTERDALAGPPPDTTTPRIEDPADMLRDALALMDNGERNYSARERVGLYLVALRESGCALVRSDDLGRLSAENARAQKGEATLQAGLRHIADGQECTTYTSPATCRTSGRTRDAKYGADRWCDACIANDTLTE